MRLLLPLAILGFLSSRLLHADDWLTHAGFQVPNLGRDDYRQPLYLPPLPLWLAWSTAAATVASGLAFAIGWRARLTGGVFAFCLFYFALADRLAAFTVSKLGTVLILALAVTPAAARYSLDARPRGSAREQPGEVTQVTWGNVRFFQALLVVFYCASGVCKARGDWLYNPLVIFTHLHSSYQTLPGFLMARTIPAWAWAALGRVTLGFEALAPLWFALTVTRPIALAVGLALHGVIALCFAPLIWFSLLMSVLLVGCFAPLGWLKLGLGRLRL